MTAQPYARADRVFWVVDIGSSHRGQASIDRMVATTPPRSHSNGDLPAPTSTDCSTASPHTKPPPPRPPEQHHYVPPAQTTKRTLLDSVEHPTLSASTAIVVGMASSAALPNPAPVPPPADPQAIRACLTPTLVAEFDREWDIVLERAKQAKDLASVHALLNKWRHFAYAQMRDPGSYFRLLAKAEQITRTGQNPDAVPIEDMRALLRQRLGR